MRVFNLEQGFGVVVAVSGGLDSVCLLRALVDLQVEFPLRIVVGHFNHKLRLASEGEERFVFELAAQYRVPIVCGKPLLPWCEGQNVEEWARVERYAFLERTRQEAKASLIVTAHHANDVAETLLFKLLSGRLLQTRNTIAAIDPTRRIVRPLSEVSRETVEDYANSVGLVHVEDQSNADLRRTRNFLRHRVLPSLRKRFGETLDARLSRTAKAFNRDESFLLQLANDQWRRGQKSRSREFLINVDPALRLRILREILNEDFPDFRASYLALEKMDRVLSGMTKAAQLGAGLVARLENGELKVSQTQELDTVFSFPLTLPGTHEITVPGGVLIVEAEVGDYSESIADLKRLGKGGGTIYSATASFDLESLKLALPLSESQLHVRSRIQGDRMRVFGGVKRRVKKLFQEQGVRLTLRSSIPIVEYGGAIIWIPGVARSDIAPIREGSRVLVLRSQLFC